MERKSTITKHEERGVSVADLEVIIVLEGILEQL
jgi:hypothetical protein